MESLRRHIFYRSEVASIDAFAPGFRLESRREADFILDRVTHSRSLRRLRPIAGWAILRPFLRRVCVRLAGVVLVFRRIGDTA
jgi:hypothetical protein